MDGTFANLLSTVSLYTSYIQIDCILLNTSLCSLNIQKDFLVKVFSPTENRWFNLPRGVIDVHKRDHRIPFTLFELCIRKIYTNFWGPILDNLLAELVPRIILYYIKMGPIGHCGNGYCSNPIFKDCHFLLLKK